LLITGVNPQRDLVEIVELSNHPWFVGCQFHPEFKSRPLDPHPLFASFIEASLQNRKQLDKAKKGNGKGNTTQVASRPRRVTRAQVENRP